MENKKKKKVMWNLKLLKEEQSAPGILTPHYGVLVFLIGNNVYMNMLDETTDFSDHFENNLGKSNYF